MAITLTPNVGLVKVTVGTENGTWGPYINQNQDILDSLFGGLALIGLGGGSIVLSTAQAQNGIIGLTDALVADVTVTFPNIGKQYTIINTCTNNASFIITLIVNGGTQWICAMPHQTFDIVTIPGGGIDYRNLGKVGEYWDFGGTSVPRWVSGASTPKYLLCDGGTFNAATYPVLNSYLGGNTLPDLRGRIRANYNAGTGRITVAGSGIDGNTLTSAGGNELMQFHTHTGTTGGQSADHTHAQAGPTLYGDANPAIQNNPAGSNMNSNLHNTGGASNDHTHNFTTDGTGGGGSQNMPPVAIGGITMIRAG